MQIENPGKHHLPQLRGLWQTAFGDDDWFLDLFFNTAYAPQRCRCVLEGDCVAAVLYWLDCETDSGTMAYIYAVATHPAHRNRGLCRALMADTHRHLAAMGYAGALLVPQQESLRRMYAGMGYADCGSLREFSCNAGPDPLPVRTVGPSAFARLRREFLPAGGVLQEGESLAFLAGQFQFYTGEGFLMTGFCQKGVLRAAELLGDPGAAPGIVRALGCERGVFRTPGTDSPFAMFHPLTQQAQAPSYFGFAFD